MWRIEALILVLVLGGTIAIPPALGQDSIDPRASYPDVGTGNAAPPHSGSLEIYFEGGDLRGGSRQVQDARRPRYRIYDEAGHFVRELVLRSNMGGPESVDLPPGKYLIETRIPYQPRTVFWVTVVQDRPTRVEPSRIPPGDFGRPPAQP